METQAGWYPDPWDHRKQRYWDGRTWTAHTAGRPHASSGLSAPLPKAQPKRRLTPPAAAPAPQPNKTLRSGPNSKRGLWLAGGILVVGVVFVMIAASMSGGNDKSTAASTSSRTHTVRQVPAATATAAVPPVQASPRAVVPPRPPITVVPLPPPPPPVPQTGIGKPVRDGKFEFIVHSWDGTTAQLSVTNISDRPYSLAMSSQYLFDEQGRKFEPEFDWTSDLAFADLNPGQTVSGALSYILSGAVGDHLELHDSMFSGGVDVKLN